MSSVTLSQDDFNAVPASGKFTLLVHIVPKAGQEATLKQALLKVSALANSDKEPGTLHYHVGESANGPKTFAVVEEYADKAAFEHHQNGADFKDLFAKAESLVETISPRFYTSLA
ncbi:unnamed protein product [Sympodiomycopsis kandeliae]